MDNNYSLSDISSVLGNKEEGFGGGAWWIIILFLFVFMGGGGGLFGNRNNAYESTATQGQMTDQFNFEALRQGQADVTSAVKDSSSSVISTVKDVAYNNLNGIRDVESQLALNSAKQDECCCNILRANDQTRYDMANFVAQINANATANTQKILDTLCANKTEALRDRVAQLEMQNAMSGVVRYPMQTSYCSGANPFGACCNGAGTTF